MYQKFIGIDISKADFCVATHQQVDTKVYLNDEAGFSAFEKDHKDSLKVGLVILETTGGYELALVNYLQAQGYKVHRANTRKVKHFIRSYGRLGKSDAIDALGLAHYGFERHESLPLFTVNPRDNLLKLVGRRTELKQMLVREKNRSKAPGHELIGRSYQLVISALSEEIELIDEHINALISEDKLFMAQKEVLKTIVGFGDITAINLLALMPELGRINRKQIASLGGLAPHPNESGQKVGYRFTRGGRREVKAVLFMAAMSASRTSSELGQTYEKFIKAGKKKMVAMTALMRKMLVIANAKIRDHYIEQGLLASTK